MHIPDGGLSFEQAIRYIIIAQLLILLSIIVLIVKWVKSKEKLENLRLKIKVFLILFIVVLLLQMFNVPIGPTNLHLIGAVMATILLGNPWIVVLLITFVLGIHTLFFGYGGLTTIGANIINIGIITNFVGYYFFIGIRKLLTVTNFISMNGNILLAAFFGAWISLIIGAFAVALELYFSGISFDWIISIVYSYAIAGILEGAITAIIIWIAISKYKMTI